MRTAKRRRAMLMLLGVIALAGALQLTNTNLARSQGASLQAYESPNDPGLDPNHPAWTKAIAIEVPLTAQAGTYPTGGGSIATVSAKALHYHEQLYVRVEWDDQTRDESTTRVQDFADAIAVEFPSKAANNAVPALCMGQADAGVNIWHWRADSQAGLRDPAEVYTTALIDAIPANEKLFYTAREAGNPFANPDLGPVQSLVSFTFGTLATASVQDVEGAGTYANGRWTVVFKRGYPAANNDQANFGPGTQTDMAFAVWNGSEGDRNGRKSVSQFVTLTVANADMPGTSTTNTTAIFLGVGMLLGIAGLGIGLGLVGFRQVK